MNQEKVDFDSFASDYDKILEKDLEFFGEENSYFAEYKIKIIKDTIQIQPDKILDYGCGIGRNIKFYDQFFPDTRIFGCDISQKSLEIARKSNPNAEFFLINDGNLDKYSGQFDIISISCVYHHIEPRLRKDTTNKIYSLLKPGGSFYIFEHNPNNPLTRKIVKDCVWDQDAILLKAKESANLMMDAGFKISKKRYTIFFPAFLKIFRPMEKFLGFIPIGGQYFMKGEKY